jgi:ABC-type uncharacterized transport system permease subunit
MPLSLTLRAVGENAFAADTVGIRVNAIRYGATLVGGAEALQSQLQVAGISVPREFR